MTKFWNWLLGLERHAVDSIVADFNGLVHRLKDASEHHIKQAEEASRLVEHYKAVEDAADAEAERAQIIAANIEALVNPTVSQ